MSQTLARLLSDERVHIQDIDGKLVCATGQWSGSAELLRPLFENYGMPLLPGSYVVYVKNKRIQQEGNDTAKVSEVWKHAALDQKLTLSRVMIASSPTFIKRDHHVLNVYTSGDMFDMTHVFLREDYVNLFPPSKLIQAVNDPLGVVSIVVDNETVGLVMPVRVVTE